MSKSKPRIILTASTAEIELGNRRGTFATLDRETFEAFKDNGIPLNFFINAAGSGQDYVRVSTGAHVGNVETVARIIRNAQCGECVRYLDGDRTNLRYENLYVVRGYAPGQTPVVEEVA